MEIEKLIILGSGPAGLTAAIYAARSHTNPLVVAGRAAGGQLMLTTDVDDFPGFDAGIQGPELMMKMRHQAEKFNTRFINEDVVSVDFSVTPYVIKTETQELKTKTVIIATGASAMWLGLESEAKFIGHGVSACAVCDGMFFKDKKVMVVGGGDAAMREAQHLSKMTKQVTIVHRRDTLKAQPALQELIRSKPNVDFLWNSELVEYLGTEKLERVKIKNNKTGELSELPIDGVFMAIGHKPSTDFLKGQLELDEIGYVKVYDSTRTSKEGIFWAGDVADKVYKQAVTAAGAGCKAAMDADNYLETHK